jgi:hypothetical protein
MINVTRVGTAGDPDLYISFSPNYPSSGRAWSSLNIGDEHYIVDASSPDYQSGTVYLYVHGFCGEEINCNSTHPVTANYEIVTTLLAADSLSIPSGQVTIPEAGVARRKICIPATTSDLCIGLTGITGDPDLYASNTLRMPEKGLDPIWTAAGGPHDDEYLFISRSDSEFKTGTYHVEIHAYCDPSITCVPATFNISGEAAQDCCTIFPGGPGCAASSTTSAQTTDAGTTGIGSTNVSSLFFVLLLVALTLTLL